MRRSRYVAVALALGCLLCAGRARAAEHLLVAFHLDLNMGAFLMGDERALGHDVEAGPLRYYDSWFNMWLTAGIQVRPHPIVAIDLSTGWARWTGSANHSEDANLFCWRYESVFRVRDRIVPLELAIKVNFLEAPGVSLGVSAAPGVYFLFREVRNTVAKNTNSEGWGAGGRIALLLGTAAKTAFEFNLEIGYRFVRVVSMNDDKDLPGRMYPDFSGPYLTLNLLFGGGTADPEKMKKEKQPEPAPATQPTTAPATQPTTAPATQPATSPAPLPPSGAPVQ